MPTAVILDGMATDKRGSDRHKHKGKPVQLRLPAVIRQQLETLSRRNLTTMTAEVIAALRAHLAANGLWPPKPS